MKIKLISIPFHWLYPNAPEKYAGCRVSIPAYDPNAPERGDATIRAARVASFNAAVGSVDGKRFRGPKLPRSVLIPTVKLEKTEKDCGRGRNLTKVSAFNLGFRRFKIDDLMSMPFAKCPSEAVDHRTLRKLRWWI